MNLTEMRTAIRTELSDSATFFSNDEIDRGVTKCVSLMSRFIPKRAILETTIKGKITDEALTISGSAGTTTYKPIKPGTFSIDGKTLDTDYTINYLTGVVTGINSLLTDGAYVCDYERDPLMLDISTLLPEEDYIKIERIESPAGNNPPTYLTYDVYGEFLIIRGSGVGLTEDEHLRVIYHKPWTAPTPSTAASLTTSLGGDDNDLVFTARTGGVIGNSITITYDNPGGTGAISVAVTGTDIVVTLARTAGTITSTGATVKAAIDAKSDAVTLVSVANATSNDGTGLVTAMSETSLASGSDTGVDGDYPEHLDNAVIIGSAGQTLIFKAEKYVQSAVSALSSITAPTLHIYTEINAPGIPALPSSPTTPTAPTPDYSATALALTAVGDEITAAKLHHTAGIVLINVPTGGERVAATYGAYANSLVSAAGIRVNEGMANLERQGQIISLFASEVAAYGSKVNEYANLMSGTMGKYREQIAGQGAAIASNNAMVAKYVSQASEQEMKARNWLDIAGRYLASGQAKINEFLAALGIKPEFSTSRSSSEQRA